MLLWASLSISLISSRDEPSFHFLKHANSDGALGDKKFSIMMFPISSFCSLWPVFPMSQDKHHFCWLSLSGEYWAWMCPTVAMVSNPQAIMKIKWANRCGQHRAASVLWYCWLWRPGSDLREANLHTTRCLVSTYSTPGASSLTQIVPTRNVPKSCYMSPGEKLHHDWKPLVFM